MIHIAPLLEEDGVNAGNREHVSVASVKRSLQYRLLLQEKVAAEEKTSALRSEKEVLRKQSLGLVRNLKGSLIESQNRLQAAQESNAMALEEAYATSILRKAQLKEFLASCGSWIENYKFANIEMMKAFPWGKFASFCQSIDCKDLLFTANLEEAVAALTSPAMCVAEASSADQQRIKEKHLALSQPIELQVGYQQNKENSANSVAVEQLESLSTARLPARLKGRGKGLRSLSPPSTKKTANLKATESKQELTSLQTQIEELEAALALTKAKSQSFRSKEKELAKLFAEVSNERDILRKRNNELVESMDHLQQQHTRAHEKQTKKARDLKAAMESQQFEIQMVKEAVRSAVRETLRLTVARSNNILTDLGASHKAQTGLESDDEWMDATTCLEKLKQTVSVSWEVVQAEVQAGAREKASLVCELQTSMDMQETELAELRVPLGVQKGEACNVECQTQQFDVQVCNLESQITAVNKQNAELQAEVLRLKAENVSRTQMTLNLTEQQQQTHEQEQDQDEVQEHPYVREETQQKENEERLKLALEAILSLKSANQELSSTIRDMARTVSLPFSAQIHEEPKTDNNDHYQLAQHITATWNDMKQALLASEERCRQAEASDRQHTTKMNELKRVLGSAKCKLESVMEREKDLQRQLAAEKASKVQNSNDNAEMSSAVVELRHQCAKLTTQAVCDNLTIKQLSETLSALRSAIAQTARDIVQISIPGITDEGNTNELDSTGPSNQNANTVDVLHHVGLSSDGAMHCLAALRDVVTSSWQSLNRSMRLMESRLVLSESQREQLLADNHELASECASIRGFNTEYMEAMRELLVAPSLESAGSISNPSSCTNTPQKVNITSSVVMGSPVPAITVSMSMSNSKFFSPDSESRCSELRDILGALYRQIEDQRLENERLLGDNLRLEAQMVSLRQESAARMSDLKGTVGLLVSYLNSKRAQEIVREKETFRSELAHQQEECALYKGQFQRLKEYFSSLVGARNLAELNESKRLLGALTLGSNAEEIQEVSALLERVSPAVIAYSAFEMISSDVTSMIEQAIFGSHWLSLSSSSPSPSSSSSSSSSSSPPPGHNDSTTDVKTHQGNWAAEEDIGLAMLVPAIECASDTEVASAGNARDPCPPEIATSEDFELESRGSGIANEEFEIIALEETRFKEE